MRVQSCALTLYLVVTMPKTERQSTNTVGAQSKRQRTEWTATLAVDARTQTHNGASATPSSASTSSSLPISSSSVLPTQLASTSIGLIRPSSTHGWSELPIELFDRVCSYISSPVWHTLLSLSAVSRQWRQMLDGETSGVLDCWRHVPPLKLYPRSDYLILSPARRRVILYESLLPFLCHVRSIDIHLSDGSSSLIHFLDLLFRHIDSSSASINPSSRVRLDHLAINIALSVTKGALIGLAVSRFLLRCPPLRSAVFRIHYESPTMLTTAALRHVASSGRLLHLELRAAQLSTMVWGEGLVEKQPWQGATIVQSVVLNSDNHNAPPLRLLTLRALPSLTHLQLRQSHTHDDALQDMMQHQRDHLTFLRLKIDDPLPQPVILVSCALQSLFLDIDTTVSDPLRVLHCLRLMPQLSELTVRDLPKCKGGPPMRLPPLLATLTYLQIVCRTALIVESEAAVGTELHTALPASLHCLSLSLPYVALTDTLLSSLSTQCPQLTHLHVDEVTNQHLSARCLRRLERLCTGSQLGAAVWCSSVREVEQQRLDKRWQREVGCDVLMC